MQPRLMVGERIGFSGLRIFVVAESAEREGVVERSRTFFSALSAVKKCFFWEY